ncbi:MAG: sodium:proton antiporter [Lachnospiraceae bacterium]|nr:sodium:proton antiporter [Lachnospiraceae bacterium]
MTIDQAYSYLFFVALIVFGILMAVTLIRCIIGPSINDRILSINMIGTMVVCSIAILSGLLDESWLLDVALVYVMISFLAVIILASVYIREGRRKAAASDKETAGKKEEESV